MRTNAVLFLLCSAVLAGGCSRMHAFGPEGDLAPTPRVKVSEKDAAAFDAAVELIATLKYDDAAAKLTPLMATFAEAGATFHAAEATFWLGYCREKLGNAEEADKLYDLVAREYPDTPAARQASARSTRLGF